MLEGKIGYEIKVSFRGDPPKGVLPQNREIPVWQAVGVATVVIVVFVFGGEIVAAVTGLAYEVGQALLAIGGAVAGLSRLVPARI